MQMTTRHLPPGECSGLLAMRELFLRENCPAAEDCQGTVMTTRRALVPRSGQQTAANMSTVFVARKARRPPATKDAAHTTNTSRCGTDGVTSGPATSRYTLISLRTPKRPVR